MFHYNCELCTTTSANGALGKPSSIWYTFSSGMKPQDYPQEQSNLNPYIDTKSQLQIFLVSRSHQSTPSPWLNLASEGKGNSLQRRKTFTGCLIPLAQRQTS